MRTSATWLLPSLLTIAGAIAAQDFPAAAEATVVQPQAEPSLGDPKSVLFVGPPEMAPFSLLGEDFLPGTRSVVSWGPSDSFAGTDAALPIHVLHGGRPGPVLCLTAAVHGDEINGVEAVRRILEVIDPVKLSGTVIGVPIVNMFGYRDGTRYLPDRRDLNRYFPGSRYGSIASRIAHGFFGGVIRHCGILVDFHTGSFDRNNLPQVRADLTLPAVLTIAGDLGEITVLHSRGRKGMLRVAATSEAIPAVAFELGGPDQIQVEQVEAAVAAVEVLMHRLGMSTGPEREFEKQPVVYGSRWVRADSGGLLIADVELGQRVAAGESLGHVIDPVRNTQAQLLAPIAGRVLGMSRNQRVLPGYAAFHLGKETTPTEAAANASVDTVDGEDGEALDGDLDRAADPADERASDENGDPAG